MSKAQELLVLLDEKKVVDGGVVVNTDLNPAQYKDIIKRMSLQSTIKNKKFNSLFSFYADNDNLVHLFHLMFDQDEIDSGNVSPERANKIRYVGAFKTVDKAKDFVYGGDRKFDLDQTKRKVLAPQEPYTNKELGYT